MSIKSVLGLDWFDLTVQGGVTAILMFWIAATNRQEDAIIGGSMVSIASLVLLAVRRKLALRRMRTQGLTSGEMAAERIAMLEQRVEQLEANEVRVLELEERLDFTERMLAQGSLERRELSRGEMP